MIPTLSNSILKFWRHLVFICLAALLGISLASGCTDMLLFFGVLLLGSLGLSFAIWKIKISALPLVALVEKFVSTAALLFLSGTIVAGATGLFQGEAFMQSACSGAATAARFATTILKFVAHAL